MKNPWILCGLLLVLCSSSLFGQSWMNGYRYRKKITVDKSRVVALSESLGSGVQKLDLPDFPLLLLLKDPDLRYLQGSGSNKLRSPDGRDIAFALSGSPSEPLNFQLESYVADSGKLVCWVRTPALSAAGTATAASSIYLYYGSELLHDPFGASASQVWMGEYSRLWHMEMNQAPSTCLDAQSGDPARSLSGNAGMNAGNFLPGKIGNSLKLNGLTEYMRAPLDTTLSFTLSAWIWLNSTGSEQVIMANDSVNGQFRNGFVFKVNAAGRLGMDIYRSQSVTALSGGTILEPRRWYQVSALYTGSQATLFINGAQAVTRTSIKLSGGGSIRVGCSKQGQFFLSGMIDELFVNKTQKKVEWLKTLYNNQDAPELFYTLGGEEYNPNEFFTFTGSAGTAWDLAANWSTGSPPLPGSRVIISAGKTVVLDQSGTLSLQQLMIKSAGSMSFSGSLILTESMHIEALGALKLAPQAKLCLKGDVQNDGRILLNGQSGDLEFAPLANRQYFRGSGTASVSGLTLQGSSDTCITLLDAPLMVSGEIWLKRGILDARGQLTLLASAGGIASLMPVSTDHAQLKGELQVQHYLSGKFPPPSSARSWRLLSSPLCQDRSASMPVYGLSPIQQAMFVTGAGGTSRGFDPSPLNGGTIYRHDASRPGNLSQKYLQIEDLSEQVPLGRGIYVFSRGSRDLPDAYNTQILNKPFANPPGFLINYQGMALQGELNMTLHGGGTPAEEGAGFHLLGNPYPAPLRWGSLQKTNVSDFIWLFDPLNGAYFVSDDPDLVIPSGSGFFVRLNDPASSGTLRFTEASKYQHGTNSDLSRAGNRVMAVRNMQPASDHMEMSTVLNKKLSLILKRGDFSQSCRIRFAADGNNGLDNRDALKLGDGWLSLCSLTGGQKLSIESRNIPLSEEEIPLEVKGWGGGPYELIVQQTEALRKDMEITVVDRFLNKEQTLEQEETKITLVIDSLHPESQGSSRFGLLIKPRLTETAEIKTPAVLAYPNPVSDLLYLKFKEKTTRQVTVQFADLLGRQFGAFRVPVIEGEATVDCRTLPSGFYLIKVLDEGQAGFVKSFRIRKD